MLKSALISLAFASSLYSQVVTPPTPPAPPACLSGPVSQGSVTITCVSIDTTSANGATPGFALTDGQLFQVKASSTDKDVVAFRIGLTYQVAPQFPPELNQDGSVVRYTTWATVGLSTGTLPPANATPAPVSSGLRYAFFLTSIYTPVSIQVQELKVSSAQTF